MTLRKGWQGDLRNGNGQERRVVSQFATTSNQAKGSPTSLIPMYLRTTS